MHYTVCDLLDEIICNAVYSNARRIDVALLQTEGWIRISVADDGRGMSEEELARARDPFGTDRLKHPDRRVGLGLPFLIQATEAVGGSFEMSSTPQEGTVVSASLDEEHVDTPPLGSVPQAFRTALCYDGDYEMTIVRRRGEIEYSLRRSEIFEALGDLADAQAQILLLQYLRDQEEVDGKVNAG